MSGNTGSLRRAVLRSRSVAPWLREPLLHFLVLGGLLFAVDHFLVTRSDDPRTIVVSAEVDTEAAQLFAASRGRAPNEDELKALRQRWVDNEVLYREGLALQVDHGDSAIRERVIFKSLSVVDANVKPPPHDDAVLRDWFERQRARYDEPQRFDFQEAVVFGDSSESSVRSFVRALNTGMPGGAQAGLRVFKARPRDTLTQAYGPEFAKSLEETPAGEWRAQPTAGGLRAMRLDSITPPRRADFDTLRGVVLQDWTDATMAEGRTAAVRTLAKKYTVKIADEPK